MNRLNKTNLIIILCALLFPFNNIGVNGKTHVWLQGILLKGKVVDGSMNRLPVIRGAVVGLLGRDIEAITDRHGNFTLPVNLIDAALDRCFLTADHALYNPRIIELESDIRNMVIRLLPTERYAEMLKSAEALPSRNKMIIRGHVNDSRDEILRIPDAQVFIANTNYNTKTDDNGDFSFQIPGGESGKMQTVFVFIVRKTGYEDRVVEMPKNDLFDIGGLKIEIDKMPLLDRVDRLYHTISVVSDSLVGLRLFIRNIRNRPGDDVETVLLMAQYRGRIQYIRRKVREMQEDKNDILAEWDKDFGDTMRIAESDALIKRLLRNIENEYGDLQKSMVDISDYLRNEPRLKRTYSYFSYNLYNVYKFTVGNFLYKYKFMENVSYIADFNVKWLNINLAIHTVEPVGYKKSLFYQIGLAPQILRKQITGNSYLTCYLGLLCLHWTEGTIYLRDFGVYGKASFNIPFGSRFMGGVTCQFNEILLRKKEIYSGTFDILIVSFFLGVRF